jgi:hypothetical protein
MTLPRGWPNTLNATADAWNILDNTFWYVLEPDLPATITVNGAQSQSFTVVDQTVWHISDYADGQFVGTSYTNVGGGWSEASLEGSITSDGTVSIAFTPIANALSSVARLNTTGNGDGVLQTVQSQAAPLVGTGQFITIDGEWKFQMNLDHSQGPVDFVHAADMTQTVTRGPGWDALPGYTDTSIGELFGDVTSFSALGSSASSSVANAQSAAANIFESAAFDDPTFGTGIPGGRVDGNPPPPPAVDHGRPINDPTIVLPAPPPTTREGLDSGDLGTQLSQAGGFDFLL